MPDPIPTPLPAGERSLAAVMFTDVSSYSKHMGVDEVSAMAAVQRDFREMTRLISDFKGKLLKTMGDGLLASFQSAINSVACAQEIQRTLAAAARARREGPHLQHRIGIHVGDVFVTENDVAGNGVNIAARLQARAEPGGICISQTVLEVVKHQLQLHVNYLGPQELKNIRDSVPAYQLLADLPGGPPTPAPPAAAPETKARGMSAEFALGVRTTTPTAPARRAAREEDGPFCLALLGDFGGRASRGVVESPAARRALPVDCDNFEAVLKKLGVQLRLPVCNRPGESLELKFESLEDFHPDQLVRNVPHLAKLLTLRSALLNPATSSAATQQLVGLLAATLPPQETPTTAGGPVESDADAVARLLGKPAGATTPTGTASHPRSVVDDLIKKIVAPSAVPARSVQESAALSALDLELTAQLRAVLHHPDFQSLEAAWRGVDLLVRSFGGEENLKLFLIDVSKDELLADLRASEPIETSGIAKVLATQPWAALLGDYHFGGSSEDLGLLTSLSKLAAFTGAPFLAGAKAELVGCDSFGREPDPVAWQITLPAESRAAWEKLRQSPEAAHVALALPRSLQRQPYGESGESIESFPFEELPASLPHESYLWGNSVFACGHLLASGFLEDGWVMTPHGGNLGGLPVHRYTEDGERAVKPCAEAWLTERAAIAIANHGLIPVLSVKGSDSVQVPHLQTIARPPKTLSLRPK